jgi:hypothetical protein
MTLKGSYEKRRKQGVSNVFFSRCCLMRNPIPPPFFLCCISLYLMPTLVIPVYSLCFTVQNTKRPPSSRRSNCVSKLERLLQQWSQSFYKSVRVTKTEDIVSASLLSIGYFVSTWDLCIDDAR